MLRITILFIYTKYCIPPFAQSSEMFIEKKSRNLKQKNSSPIFGLKISQVPDTWSEFFVK